MHPSVCERRLGNILKRNPDPQLRIVLYKDQSWLGSTRNGKFISTIRAAGVITGITINNSNPTSISLKRIKSIQVVKQKRNRMNK